VDNSLDNYLIVGCKAHDSWLAIKLCQKQSIHNKHL